MTEVRTLLLCCPSPNLRLRTRPRSMHHVATGGPCRHGKPPGTGWRLRSALPWRMTSSSWSSTSRTNLRGRRSRWQGSSTSPARRCWRPSSRMCATAGAPPWMWICDISPSPTATAWRRSLTERSSSGLRPRRSVGCWRRSGCRCQRDAVVDARRLRALLARFFLAQAATSTMSRASFGGTAPDSRLTNLRVRGDAPLAGCSTGREFNDWTTAEGDVGAGHANQGWSSGWRVRAGEGPGLDRGVPGCVDWRVRSQGPAAVGASRGPRQPAAAGMDEITLGASA
jgi:hypothetical protein